MKRTLSLLLLALLAGCSTSDALLFLTRPGNGTTGSQDEVNGYYAKVGQMGFGTLNADATFGEWLKNRCFLSSNNGFTSAFYYNGADLGLGRELYCWKCPAGDANAGVISCSVSNHGVPQGLDLYAFDLNDPDPALRQPGRNRQASIHNALTALNNFRDAVEKKNGAAPTTNTVDAALPLRGASVVFDFDPRRAGNTKMQMYIYDANQFALFSAVNPLFAQAKAKNQAGDKTDRSGAEHLIAGLQLDGEGGALNARVKFIRNCLSCHGGRYDERDNLIHGATFLDFDAVLFNYSDDPDPAIRLANGENLRTSCKNNVQRIDSFPLMSQYVLTVANAAGANLLADRVTKNLANNFFLTTDAAGRCIPDPNKTYVPDGWNKGRTVARFRKSDGSVEDISDARYFEVVVHKYCASCHFSQTPVSVGSTARLQLKDPGQPLTFADAEQWFKNENLVELDILRKSKPRATSADLIRQDVCGASEMPHAEVTRNNMKRDSLAFAYVCNAEPVAF